MVHPVVISFNGEEQGPFSIRVDAATNGRDLNPQEGNCIMEEGTKIRGDKLGNIKRQVSKTK